MAGRVCGAQQWLEKGFYKGEERKQAMRQLRRGLLPALCVGLAIAAVSANAAVTVPNIIGDHMVLQANGKDAIWGKADPGEKITVSVAGKTAATKADGKGAWRVNLTGLKTGGPHQLTIDGAKDHLKFSDVLVGEVWVCSGQSNMQFQVKQAINGEQEAAAANFPQIHLFITPRKTSTEPKDNCDGKWAVCTPDSVGGFSAVGYFFGRKLHQDLKVPVGMIETDWGGTPAEAWTSLPALNAKSEFKPLLEWWEGKMAQYPEAKKKYDAELTEWQKAADAAKAANQPAPKKPNAPADPASPNRPANLYNGMISPLHPYGIQGAIWYQGESNGPRAYQYRSLFPTMISDWRAKWGGRKFPFYFVQLANWEVPLPKDAPAPRVSDDSTWAELREAQTMTLLLPNTGMALALDIGDAKDIHPKNKQDVGKRLALNAEAKVYKKTVEFSGPMFKNVKFKNGSAVVTFTHADGLTAKGGKVKGFAVAGADKKFVWADAEIKGNTVVVSAKSVAKPVSVRYAWADNPDCNLYNAASLPAVPFRTDQWPGITVNTKAPK